MEAYFGYFAGLGTSLAWSFSSTLFTLGGRRLGSLIVNRARLVLAVTFVIIMHWILEGQPLPLGAEPFRWAWLGLSGLIGYVFGDGFLFQAFVMIGPRLSMLLMALAPVFSTILAWVLLGETLSVVELLGIGLTVGGVMLVIADRRNGKPSGARDGGTPPPAEGISPLARADTRHYVLGVLCGLGGALGQAGGLFASRMGLAGNFPALSGNLMRLLVATAAIWLVTLVSGQIPHTLRRLRAEPRATLHVLGGAFAGPFIGVWLSLIAVQQIPLGIATTLTSLSPIVLLFIGRLLFKERITGRAVLGTLIAITGTVLLFLK